jgi:hypothetical protein
MSACEVQAGSAKRVWRMVGKVGRVTGRVAPGVVGEVMIAVRGGSEAFYASADDEAETMPIGTLVLVVDYHPPRHVIVVRVKRN